MVDPVRVFDAAAVHSAGWRAGNLKVVGGRLTPPAFLATNARVSHPLPPCPQLPPPRAALDWRTLHVHREDVRGEEFYHDCLEYAHSLWQRGLAARAILCLDRAFGADLRGDETILQQWPWPYAATQWILRATPPDIFIGNPRVHFQHYADRVNEPRREQRRWRAWACWAIAREALPLLPADSKHAVDEPSHERIVTELHRHGTPGEAELWQQVLNRDG